MKWLKHDSDAHRDAKLMKVIIKYGMEGYGLYWYCVELVAADVDQNNLTFELEHDAEIISHHTGIHVERINEMMAFMINLELFESSGNTITCLKIAKRLDQSMTSNPQMRKLIEKVKRNHDGVMTESEKVMQDKTRLDKTRLEKKNNKATSPKVAPVPITKVIDRYHEKLPTLPRIVKRTPALDGAIKQRWREDMPSMEQWDNFFDYVSESTFLMGRAEPSPGKQPFIADLHWITKLSNFAKIAQGKYHVRAA